MNTEVNDLLEKRAFPYWCIPSLYIQSDVEPESEPLPQSPPKPWECSWMAVSAMSAEPIGGITMAAGMANLIQTLELPNVSSSIKRYLNLWNKRNSCILQELVFGLDTGPGIARFGGVKGCKSNNLCLADPPVVKSYPSQRRPVETHRMQFGRDSSHLMRLILHVAHPGLTLDLVALFRRGKSRTATAAIPILRASS